MREALAALLRDPSRWPRGLAIDDAVLQLAQAEGLSALLHDALARNPGAPVAPESRARLARHVFDAAAQDLLRQRELERLLGVFSDAGLQPVLLKGRALAYLLYPQPVLRPSVDVDLMVPPAGRQAAAALLRAQGYDCGAFQGGELVNAQASYWRDLAPGARMLVDLHWRISTSPLFAHVLPHDWLWPRAQRIPALGPHARGPAFADALLHACVHRAPLGERADRLIWLYDIHLLARRLDEQGWTEFVGLAARHRLRAICLDALQAATRWLATECPRDVRAALSDAPAEPSATLLRGGALRLKWAELRGLRGLRERLTWLRESALPAPGYLYDRYGTRPRWLLPALYARRALDWLAR